MMKSSGTTGMADRAEFFRALAELKVSVRHGRKSPHKPLLLLLALGNVAQGKQRLQGYAALAGPLEKLLTLFGLPRQAVCHPEYPFGRLCSSGLWQVTEQETLKFTSSGDLSPRELVECNIHGGFVREVHDLLCADPMTLQQGAQFLLNRYFPPSLHEDIKWSVGLPFETLPGIELDDAPQRVRDPRFRAIVLDAYRERCAICRHHLKMGPHVLGLEAAHIRAFCDDGPNTPQNGLALCSFHHRAFDMGAIGLERRDRSYRVLVSQEAEGDAASMKILTTQQGRPIEAPTRDDWAPCPDHVDWHSCAVFRHPART